MVAPYLSRSHEAGIPAVGLRGLLPHAEFHGCRDLVVTGGSDDARRIEPGQVFFALDDDGAALAPLAIERGASGIVSERLIEGAGALQVVVQDARSARARVGQALAGDPSHAIPTLALAGRSADRATRPFLAAILEADGRRVGSLSGPGATDAPAIASGLAAIADRRDAIGLIAPSTAALQARAADGLALAGVLYLTEPAEQRPDPEDRSELRAVARLVRSLVPGGIVVLDADDPEAALLAATNLEARVVRFGRKSPADITADVVSSDLDGTRLRLHGLDRECTIDLRPIGEEAIRGALAAAATARALGASDGAIIAGLESVARLPGHIEPIVSGRGPRVFADGGVDRPAIAEAVRTLRERVAGEVVTMLVVPAVAALARADEMVAAVEADSGRVVLTRPSSTRGPIDLEAWLGRFRRPGRVRVSTDRRKALVTALESCGAGDVVLILGPGDEGWAADAIRAHAWIAGETSRSRRSA